MATDPIFSNPAVRNGLRNLTRQAVRNVAFEYTAAPQPDNRLSHQPLVEALGILETILSISHTAGIDVDSVDD